MIFNSIHFLIFFPIVTLVYFVLPHKFRWIWLLIASYYFYMSWNPRYILLIATSTVLTYLSGILIDRANKIEDRKKSVKRKKLWVALSFISNLSILFFFKYFYFTLDNINNILSSLNMQIIAPSFDVLLPVGISFYTFQALSYTVDVYREEIYAERNLAKYALFVSFFPQLVAGPIERSKNLLIQINEKHTFDYQNMKNGLLLILWGLFQKIVIADRVAILVNNVFDNYTSFAGFEIVIAILFFAIQIYCDFSGYCDIAIGAAQIMGFRLMDNFRQPYYATSIQDFWRRWHISLSTWFRDYLYIPLGGSRCVTWKKYRNLIITFLVSGLWHGASWNYVIWGGLHGLYQTFGAIVKPYKDKLYRFLHLRTDAPSFQLGRGLCTFTLVCFAWIFFRAPDLTAALGVISQMTSRFNPWVFFDQSLYGLGLDSKDFMLSILCIVILLAVNYMQTKIRIREKLEQQNLVFRWAVYYLAVFFLLIFGVYGPGYDANQFIYFQF